MKILYVYNEYPKTYQAYLLGLLKSIKKRLDVKTMVYRDESEADYVHQSFSFKDRIHRLLYKLQLIDTPSFDLKFMQQFDIVHLQHSYLWHKALPLLKLKQRPKIVVTLRGGDTYLKPWSYKRMEKFYRDSSNLVDAFIVMSVHQKTYLEHWGVAKEKIHVIPISFGELSKKQPKYPNKEKIKLVSAFRMTWEKNILRHIEFAKCLKDCGVLFEYDIYGDGKDLNQLYFLVHKFDLEGLVRIKRKISNEDLQNIFNSYDFCIQLSLSESLGMTVIEAQSHGVPCIISDAGGLPEAVIKDETAIIDNTDEDIRFVVNACLDLWKNKALYYNYSKNAIAHVNNAFTVSHEVQQLEELYEALYRL